MKTAVSPFRSPARRRAAAGPDWLAGLVLGLAVSAGSLEAQTTVKTLGGGHADRYSVPNGYVDGNTLEEAMFNAPLGMAIGPDGNLWFADRDNGAIRKLLLSAGQTRTVMTNLSSPVGITFDRGGNFYVLSAGNGTIKEYDTNLNALATITTALVGPTAFTIDSATNFFVAQANGTVVRVKPSDAVPKLIGIGLNNPGGLTITADGYLVVCDSGNHVIKTFDPALAPTAGAILSGTVGVAGLTNGNSTLAKFNSPQGIAQAPNGMFLVADRLNHQVRLVQTNGYAATFYGVPVANWVSAVSPGIGYNGGTIWPGWADGPVDPTDPLKLYPAAHDPMSVLITAGGDVYTTEWGYHIIRQVTGGNLTGGGPGGGGTGTDTNAVVVLTPTLTPDRGYFPNGQMIRIGSPNPDVFYTTDGSEPTTNSLRVHMTGNWGLVWWQNTQFDLTKLAVKAFIGTNASATARGLPVTANTVGITASVTTNYYASPGSTIFVPVVVDLMPGAQIRSIFYRVDVQAPAGAPSVSDQFRLIPVSTNDFIQVVALPNSSMTALGYGDPGGTLGGQRGLLISAVGTNLGGTITSFGVLNMLAIPIPPTAPFGAVYTVAVSNPSATSDGFQTRVAIVPGGSATIVVGAASSGIGVGGNANGGVGVVSLPAGAVGYLVGDSSPNGWFNAGEFGDGNLDNADVNNAFYASLGIKVPPSFSDAFDAMDAFPLDSVGWGGDGEIRFLDWQVILLRASRLDPNNYIRVREASGAKTVIGPFGLTGVPDGAGTTTTELPGSVWVKQAQIFAGFTNAQPGAVAEVPVYVKLVPGFNLSGMLFHARVIPRGTAPPVTGVTFKPTSAALQPTTVSDGDPTLGADSLYRVWQQFPTRLQGLTLLGYIEFTVPAEAKIGNVYGVRFIASSGGDMTVRPFQEPQFESLPGAVFVGVPPTAPPVRISDEWRVRFFGSLDNPDAADDADPDGDGVLNWKEFLAGTNPTRADSNIRLRPGTVAGHAVGLNLLTAPGKTYQIEYTEDLRGGVWTSGGSVVGDGNYQDIQVPMNPLKPRFYRVRLAP